MEAQPIYSGNIYTLCQLPCKCRTCGNDTDGVCGIDKGNCESAQRSERCPVKECEAWTPKNTEECEPVWLQNISTFTYPPGSTIADKARELREAFREQYGLDVDIQIHAYSSRKNPDLDKERAEQWGLEMARELGESARSGHKKGDTARWYHIEARQANVRIALFYPDEGGCHGSGSDL